MTKKPGTFLPQLLSEAQRRRVEKLREQIAAAEQELLDIAAAAIKARQVDDGD